MSKKKIVIEYDNDLEVRYGGAFSGENPTLEFHDSEGSAPLVTLGLTHVDSSGSDDVVWFDASEEPE